MVYMRSDILCRRTTDYEANSVELLVLEVLPKHRHNKRQTKWLFLSAYNPPEDLKWTIHYRNDQHARQCTYQLHLYSL